MSEDIFDCHTGWVVRRQGLPLAPGAFIASSVAKCPSIDRMAHYHK